MITLYGFKKTRSTRIAWMLEELQQAYHYCSINLMMGEGRKPEFLAINHAGKVPAIQDNHLVLTESAAIVTYLGDKFNCTELVPAAGTPERGKYDQWCHFAMSELEQPLWTLVKHSFALPEKYRLTDIIPSAEWEFQKHLKTLSTGLADRKYILGENFSAADILLVQTLLWGKNLQQNIEQRNLQDYIDRASQRPALKRAVQREKTECS